MEENKNGGIVKLGPGAYNIGEENSRPFSTAHFRFTMFTHLFVALMRAYGLAFMGQ